MAYLWDKLNPIARKSSMSNRSLSEFSSKEARKNLKSILGPGVYVVYCEKAIPHWGGVDDDGIIYIGQSGSAVYERLYHFATHIIEKLNHASVKSHSAARRYQLFWDRLAPEVPRDSLKYCFVKRNTPKDFEDKLICEFYRKFLALPPLNSKSDRY